MFKRMITNMIIRAINEELPVILVTPDEIIFHNDDNIFIDFTVKSFCYNIDLEVYQIITFKGFVSETGVRALTMRIAD